MNATLSGLPGPVRYRLLAASSGKHHLAETGREAMAAAQALTPAESGAARGLLALAKELFVAAWLADPLDGVMAADLAEFDRRLPGLDPAAARCVAVAASLCALPQGGKTPPRLARLEEAGDYPALRGWLLAELKRSSDNGFLSWCLYSHAMGNGDAAQALAVAKGLSRIPVLAPGAAKLEADALFLAGDYEAAAEAYGRAEEAFPGLCSDRAGEALWRAGRCEEALSRLRAAYARAPWLTHAALRLHDLSCGLDAALAPLPGKAAVLLYSFNNAQKLDLTLQSLHESLASGGQAEGGVLVRVLDNGSKDETAAVIKGWAGRFGEVADFGCVTLPVNVGAAPARNWLAALPEVGACDFAAFLDDDVRLPQDWLSRLGAAVAACPEAGLWGCRVTDYERTAILQQVDLNLLPPRQGDSLFSMSEAQLGTQDFGQFAYLRPATSVTGCCHLFRVRTLLASGGFDIRFSPTQYDDLDHDLRLGLSGERIVYQGHLAVEHMKLSGRAVARSKASSANAAANMYKLKSKYEEADIQTLRERAQAALEADLAAKLAKLGLTA